MPKKGYKQTLEHRKKIQLKLKDKNAPNYKDGRTFKIYHCIICGKKICYCTWLYGSKKCSSCVLKLYYKENPNFNKKENHPFFGKFGEDAPNWIDGISFEPYSINFNDELKESIRQRDNYKCQKCGIKQEDYYRKLDIHHIDYNKNNCDKDNLISLCQQCNLEVNFDRDYWYAYFTYVMEII